MLLFSSAICYKLRASVKHEMAKLLKLYIQIQIIQIFFYQFSYLLFRHSRPQSSSLLRSYTIQRFCGCDYCHTAHVMFARRLITRRKQLFHRKINCSVSRDVHVEMAERTNKRSHNFHVCEDEEERSPQSKKDANSCRNNLLGKVSTGTSK